MINNGQSSSHVDSQSSVMFSNEGFMSILMLIQWNKRRSQLMALHILSRVGTRDSGQELARRRQIVTAQMTATRVY